MNKKIYKNYSELAKDMVESIEGAGDTAYSNAVLFYKDTVGMLKTFIKDFDVSLGSIELEEEEWSGYDREYYLSIDTDNRLSIEQAWVTHRKNGEKDAYALDEADKEFVHSDTNSKVLQSINRENCVEIEFEDDIDEEDDDDVMILVTNSDKAKKLLDQIL